VIEAHRAQHGHVGVEDVGGIEAPAETDFDDREIDAGAREQFERGERVVLEEGQCRVAARSLDTLERVARALGVPVGDLFRAYDLPAGGARLVRSDEGMEVVRGGTQRGYTYNLLAYDKGPRRSFEPFLVTMNDETEVFPSFEHPGTEFIHLLQGRIEYRHGRHTYLMEPGDSLTFRGDIPHGPERLLEVPVRLLSMIVYGPGELD
jgi:hypothetical protein